MAETIITSPYNSLTKVTSRYQLYLFCIYLLLEFFHLGCLNSDNKCDTEYKKGAEKYAMAFDI